MPEDEPYHWSPGNIEKFWSLCARTPEGGKALGEMHEASRKLDDLTESIARQELVRKARAYSAHYHPTRRPEY